jgi:hypothetical protein
MCGVHDVAGGDLYSDARVVYGVFAEERVEPSFLENVAPYER